MHAHGGAGGGGDGGGIGFAAGYPFGDGPAGGDIAVDGIVGGGLVGDDIGVIIAGEDLRENFSGVAEQADGARCARAARIFDHGHGLFQRFGARVEIAGFQAFFDAAILRFHGEHGGTGQRCGQRLRAAHAAEAAGENPFAGQAAAEMLAADFDKGLVGALHDALAADVDPGAGGHLPIHHQAEAIERGEMLPRGPVRHEVAVGDEHAGGIGMGAEDAGRLAGLHKQGFVGVQGGERADDAVVAGPVAGGTADAAVDDQIFRAFGDIRIQVVHQHAQRRFGLPGFCRELRSGTGPDDARVFHGEPLNE